MALQNDLFQDVMFTNINFIGLPLSYVKHREKMSLFFERMDKFEGRNHDVPLFC